MEILLGALIAAAVAAALAWPLWRPGPVPVDVPRGPAARAAELRERKELTYAAIRELGLDYRTGKLTEEDYEDEVARLKGEAVRIVQELEELDAGPPRGSEALEAEVARRVARLSAAASPTGSSISAAADAEGERFCTRCGRRAMPDDRFCAGCGARLSAAGRADPPTDRADSPTDRADPPADRADPPTDRADSSTPGPREDDPAAPGDASATAGDTR